MQVWWLVVGSISMAAVLTRYINKTHALLSPYKLRLFAPSSVFISIRSFWDKCVSGSGLMWIQTICKQFDELSVSSPVLPLELSTKIRDSVQRCTLKPVCHSVHLQLKNEKAPAGAFSEYCEILRKFSVTPLSSSYQSFRAAEDGAISRLFWGRARRW